MQIAALLAYGTFCYGLFWFLYRMRGGITVLPTLRPLWLLVLAAVIFAATQIVLILWR